MEVSYLSGHTSFPHVVHELLVLTQFDASTALRLPQFTSNSTFAGWLIFMLFQLILYVPDLKQYLNEKYRGQSADYDRKQYLSLQEVSDKIKIMILLHNSEITSFIIVKKSVFVFPCE